MFGEGGGGGGDGGDCVGIVVGCFFFGFVGVLFYVVFLFFVDYVYGVVV